LWSQNSLILNLTTSSVCWAIFCHVISVWKQVIFSSSLLMVLQLKTKSNYVNNVDYVLFNIWKHIHFSSEFSHIFKSVFMLRLSAGGSILISQPSQYTQWNVVKKGKFNLFLITIAQPQHKNSVDLYLFFCFFNQRRQWMSLTFDWLSVLQKKFWKIHSIIFQLHRYFDGVLLWFCNHFNFIHNFWVLETVL